MGELEDGVADLAYRFWGRDSSLPLESPCDHEMDDQEKIVIKPKDDALAEPTHVEEALSRELCKCRTE